ncbi:hypothetical protein MKEN_00091400 [Mycena kentingensis (nom. inval.)]|nr:hypothetical protein MKEN_00091400 [Mycena kentingensis (nom. inval.)]
MERSTSRLVPRFPSRSIPTPVSAGRTRLVPSTTMPQTSAIPLHYFCVFAVWEPLLTSLGFLGVLLDPKRSHDLQAPWPNGKPWEHFPLATKLTVTQLGHVCALLGLLNIWLLSSARSHLSLQPALQEKIVSALLTPLLIGDFMHIYITLWALGEYRFQFSSWSPMLIVTILSGFTLLIPRLMWQLGIASHNPTSFIYSTLNVMYTVLNELHGWFSTDYNWAHYLKRNHNSGK